MCYGAKPILALSLSLLSMKPPCGILRYYTRTIKGSGKNRDIAKIQG